MRRGLALLVVALLGAACASVGEAGAPEPGGGLTEVEDGLRSVAGQWRDIDADVDAALRAVRRADEVVARSRSVARAEEGLDDVEEAREVLDAVDVGAVRGPLNDLGARIDEVRAELARVHDEDDGWRARYLDAQDEVLRAGRAHAAEGDALLQHLERHRATYDGALGALEGVRDERDHRIEALEQQDPPPDPLDVPEAVAVALDGHLDGLALAQDDLHTYRQRREESAAAVHDATAEAAAVFDERPTG